MDGESTIFSSFPGNKLISSPETFGWAVVSGYSEEVKEGAVEFLKFRTKLNLEEKEELLSSSAEELIPAEQDYIKAYQGKPPDCPQLSGEVELDPSGRGARGSPPSSGGRRDQSGGIYRTGG